jgi:hypothetical protein
MVGHGNQGDGAVSGKKSKSGYINPILVDGSSCCELMVESDGI